ncbi:MAG: Asp-tRNA(Asn)/Glu-tRNA(Gln) amidotransferase subunit GatC [Clostridia bacterium]|nr:Asp-tRNA(Asn)/Glu-tRNA(Gln) amidotransferase subunit GatC [Clostridia bacterium]
MKIDQNEVKHVAALARLRIDEAETEKWSEQMGAIIEFADSLCELDLSDAEALEKKNNGTYNVFREDETGESFSRERILANAPEQLEGCYVVPKIVE